MDRATVNVYENHAADWIAHRQRPLSDAVPGFVTRTGIGPRADLGCGPGWHSAALDVPVVALDAAAAMTRRVRDFAPDAWPVVGDLEHLPFRRGALAGAWAHRCYMHLRSEHLPFALADCHRAVRVGGALHIQVTSDRKRENVDDRFPGRHFSWWPAARLHDVVEGAGFTIESFVDDGDEWLDVEATRARTLADTVGESMRLLIVGLNPSEYAADAGVGFARPGNRFWPAALAAGVVTRTHDARHALVAHRVGMTDLVKRATPRADALAPDEYRAGTARVERLVAWLQPRAVCFAGLTGYRVAIDRRASTGWQDRAFGGRPAYVMPNPSGLNAHATPSQLAEHLRTALSPPRGG
jgi:TDG/mug DNA glycosylase family protein